MDGGDGDGIAQSQIVELIKHRVRFAHRVGLVDGQHHRLLGAQQHIGHVLIGGGDTGADVAHQHDHIGVLDGQFRLIAHELQDLAVGIGLNAAGVHDGEGASAPLTVGVKAVARDAGGVLHDGQALPGQTVKQHGLSHVGAAHNGNDRLHINSLPLFGRGSVRLSHYSR